jgi:tetratricopeptide (TPR) repeat protein
LYDAYVHARDDAATRSSRQQIPVMKGVLSTPFVFVRKSPVDLKREAAAIRLAVSDGILSMRRVRRDEVDRAAVLYEKAIGIEDDDVEARQGRARMLLYGGQTDRAERLVDEGLRREAPEPQARAEWLLIRAELSLRRGALEEAIADCAVARTQAPSLRSDAMFAMLYMTTLRYDVSADMLHKVLAKYSEPAHDQTFTDEEWGRIVLHMYISLRNTGWKKTLADYFLKSYSESYRGVNLLRMIYSNVVFRKISPWRSRLVSLGDVGVQAPWSHVVAQFMLHQSRKREQTSLTTFRTKSEPYDPRDPDAFECLLHFYRGMAYAFEQHPDTARSEFAQTVATGRTEYVEYWIAKAELGRLAGAVPGARKAH